MNRHVFNENDPHAAAWLRELIKAGLITGGVVDERAVEDIAPDDIRGHRGVHLFAGIGVWSYALRLAGWPDERPVWTCSCPCTPFSQAGKGDGFGDERHLWPAAFHLVRECRPLVLFGEQVASTDGFAWLDLVQADLEGVGYAVGAVVTPAAGFGAPHGRHRTYWCASLLADPRHVAGCAERRIEHHERDTWTRQPSPLGGVADADGGITGDGGIQRGRQHGQQPQDRVVGVAQGVRLDGRAAELSLGASGAVGGFWGDADWLLCAPEPGYPEGRWRPVEPGTFPLAHGVAARVVKLRGYGNALVAPQAAAFIRAALDQESHEGLNGEPTEPLR